MPSHSVAATLVDPNNLDNDNLFRSTSLDKGKTPLAESQLEPPKASTSFLDHSSTQLNSANRPFFIRLDEKTGGLVGGLQKLNNELVAAGHGKLLSGKSPFTWTGRTVTPGEIGIYSHGAVPRVILKAGRYPSFPLGWWWARDWHGKKELASTVISFNGLLACQVSQNQAAVVCDPANQVFILKNGGFVAMSLEGSYRVLATVDTVNLKNKVVDPFSNSKETRVLGHYEQVEMETDHKRFVVATFLDIPANNCCILQKGDELEMLPAGQHTITVPNVTIRGWFTRGENQIELKTLDMYTRDQVPLQLRMYLRWQLINPLALCHHGYSTPYEALQDKTLSVLTQLVSHLEYASLVKQRAFATGDDASAGPSPNDNTAFLDALRSRAMDELHAAALEYGISLKEVAVLDRQFKGEIAKQMDILTTRSLQAQVEASNVDRENLNRVKAQEGQLQVAQVSARQRQTEADAAAYTLLAEARAKAEAIEIKARADAEAVRIAAEAEARAIELRNAADANVKDQQARMMQLARTEVQRVSAYGNKTVFVPSNEASGVGREMLAGYSLASGGAMAAAGSTAAGKQ
ncbi:hypothetical protein OIO90_002547 [Microbotryomycetes sp. JL221]|nr:hypothetical protein OIO90_002547 [Microbotryomycetes sp. JL221]